MRTVTPQFLAAIASSHNVSLHADAYFDGVLTESDLPVVSGSVTLTRTDMVRGKLSCVIADHTGRLVPRSPTDPINVFGQEVRVRAGVQWPTYEETVSLGYFRIQSFKADERWTVHPNGVDWIRSGATITLDAMDRMARVVDARFITTLQPLPGATCISEIQRLTYGIVPWGGVDPRVTDSDAPGGLVYEEDRAAAIAKLAASIDAYCFVSGDGELWVWSTVPTDYGLRVGAGRSGVAITIDTSNSRDGVYNAVVARGEDSGTTAPYWSVAYDNDPSSPTRWDGPYGQVTGYFSSPFITTQHAADASAATRLSHLKQGQAQQYSVTIVPNPAIEPDDIVTLILPSQDEIQVRVKEVTIPLGSTEAMTLTLVGKGEDVGDEAGGPAT